MTEEVHVVEHGAHRLRRIGSATLQVLEADRDHDVLGDGHVGQHGRVLVLLRPSRKEVRLPKGHVEGFETVEEGALRETIEETGYPEIEIIGDFKTLPSPMGNLLDITLRDLEKRKRRLSAGTRLLDRDAGYGCVDHCVQRHRVRRPGGAAHDPRLLPTSSPALPALTQAAPPTGRCRRGGSPCTRPDAACRSPSSRT